MWHVAFSSKRVFEKTRPGLLHCRAAVDEGDLAEERRLLVGLELPADDVGPLRGSNVDDPALLEAQLEITDGRAADGQRVRRSHGALGAAQVR